MGLIYKSAAESAAPEEMFSPYEIHGYLVQEPLTATGGGNCKWGIVTKNGREFFLKEFLSPKFPSYSAEISPEMRRMQVQECEAWLESHTKVYQAVQASDCGDLIVPLDFFRFQNHFYMVTEKVERSHLAFSELCQKPPLQQLLILKVLAYQFALLAAHHVIHADLKPDNLMLKGTVPSFVTVKIIDFDASFLEEEPPDAEDLVGDSVYYSPEAIYYQITEGDGILTPKSDVFSLGIIFHQILTGALPEPEEEGFDTIGEAVLNDVPLRFQEGLSPEYAQLIQNMLLREPEERISAEETWMELQRLSGCEAVKPMCNVVEPQMPTQGSASQAATTSQAANRWKAPAAL